MRGDVLRRRLHPLGHRQQLPVADQPAARAVAAVGRAPVRGEEVHPIRIAVHQAGRFHVVFFAARVFHVRRRNDQFLYGRDRLAADRAIRVVPVHERNEVRRRCDGEFLARDGDPVHLRAAEVEHRLEILQRPEPVDHLPAPVAPLLGGRVEDFPSDEMGRRDDMPRRRVGLPRQHGYRARCRARRFQNFVLRGRPFRAVTFLR